MSYTLTYARCTSPDDKQTLEYPKQRIASSTFQDLKRAMKAENDNDPDSSHFIEIGITDDQGKPVDGYKHTCRCLRG